MFESYPLIMALVLTTLPKWFFCYQKSESVIKLTKAKANAGIVALRQTGIRNSAWTTVSAP